MKLLGLFILLSIGFIILFYYLYLIFVGKQLARLVNTKDRFIWNGLRNITDKASRGRATIFLDESQIIISSDSLPTLYSKMKKGALDDGIAIPFTDIAAFDYVSRSKIPFIRRIINQIFKINDYMLKISYFDDIGQIVPLKFKAFSMDSLDFEASFADFNNKIYGGKGLRKSESYEMVSSSQESSTDATAPLSPIYREGLKENTVLLSEDTPIDIKEETTILPKDSFIEEEPKGSTWKNFIQNDDTAPLPRDSFTQVESVDSPKNNFLEEGTTILPGGTFTQDEIKQSSSKSDTAGEAKLDSQDNFPEETSILPGGTFTQDEIKHSSSESNTAGEAKLDSQDNFQEETTILPGGTFTQDKIKHSSTESIDAGEIKIDSKDTSKDTFIEEEQSGPLEEQDVEDNLDKDIKVDGEKTTLLSGSIFGKKTDKAEKSSFFSRSKDSSSSEDKTILSQPLLTEESEPVEEIKRRSFLDRSDKPKEIDPVEHKVVQTGEETLILELPEELKKKDTTGVSEEDIKLQEIERLQKLKEFFAERNENQE